MRIILALLALGVLAACSGGVTGDVGRACLEAGRQAANPALCSCVQRAASQTLSPADQRRAAGFFSDPQRAQDTRQSQRSGDREFWQRYRAFVDRAEAICPASA
jgi:hypothetical protein